MSVLTGNSMSGKVLGRISRRDRLLGCIAALLFAIALSPAVAKGQAALPETFWGVNGGFGYNPVIQLPFDDGCGPSLVNGNRDIGPHVGIYAGGDTYYHQPVTAPVCDRDALRANRR